MGTLTDAERWELLCWDERIKNAQIVLGMCEGEREQARQRILIAHGLDPQGRYRFDADGTMTEAT